MRGESVSHGAAGSRADATDSAADDLLALLSAVDDWVFVLSESGRVLRASKIAHTRLGLDPAGGTEFASLWLPEQRDALEASLSSLRRGALAARILLEVR